MAGVSHPFRRVALVHDWLVGQRGGENVLLELARLFPQAPIFTLVHARGQIHPELDARDIRTSSIQALPGSPRRFRQYLPLFPRAIEAIDLRGYDLVVSTSHCVAKGVRTAPGQTHVAYIHTPMRYLYDQLPHYLPRGRWGRALAPWAERCAAPLRRWDVASAQRPTLLLANSAHVAARVAKLWNRGARVVYPPVDVEFFRQAPVRPRRGFVMVSALVPYKRLELGIMLANRHHLPLTVVGDGPGRRYLDRLAGPTVSFKTGLSRHALRQLYAGAQGLLFCGVEDFGIVPVEAMAAGCPVLALGDGGVTETVVEEGPHATGIFFGRPTLEAMDNALQRYETARARGAFARSSLEARARKFDRRAFVEGMERAIDHVGARVRRRAG